MPSDIYSKLHGILLPAHEEHRDRIESELAKYENDNCISSFYALYQDILNKRALPGDVNEPNSLCGFLLGLTSAKPVDAFNIPLCRTYARDGFPDVDMDFDNFRRPEVFEYIINKYGRDCVCNIGTVGQLKLKSALRRSIKVLDPGNFTAYDSKGTKVRDDHKAAFQLENDILNSLPEWMKDEKDQLIETVEKAYELIPDFRKYMDLYPEVYELTKKIQGTLSTAGGHAAGVVISPVPLKTIVPMHITKGDNKRSLTSEDGKKEDILVATQYTMEEVEMLGLIKFDVLGLSTKTTIHKTKKLIKDRHNIDLDLSNLPLNDKDVFKMISSGKVQGCFQLDNSPGMVKAVCQIGVDCFNDLQAVIAMYRPGPMQYIELYANRKSGKTQTIYDHPVLEANTKNTYGIIVYQEQLMRVFVEMAGLSETYGYKFLKVCAKKKKDQQFIDEAKNSFLRGCKNNGVKDHVAAKVFADLEKFAGYAFNASHAAAYAYESYKTAYLKTHYPAEYMSCLLSVEAYGREFDYVKEYEQECKINLGISIEPPDINLSTLDYTIVDEKRLRRSLLIDGIGEKAATEIISHQPYKGKNIFFSFASKVGSNVNVRVIESMCKHGIFKFLKKPNEEILKDFEKIKKDKTRTKGMPTGRIF